MGQRTGLILFAVNAVWSLHPVMSKWALEVFSPLQVALLRYLGAAAAFFAILVFSPSRRKSFLASRPRSARELALFAVVGLAPFCFSPLLQLQGLTQTHAVDNALIVSLEPLFTVALSWLLLRGGTQETPPSGSYRGNALLVWILAFAGLFLLTGLPAIQGEMAWTRVAGNLLLVVSLFGEASYSVAGQALLQRGKSSVGIFGYGIFLGVGGLLLFGVVTGHLTLGMRPDPGAPWIRALLGLLWLGPVGTALCYLVWVRCLEKASLSQAALSLFFQPLLGTLGGVLILGERLSGVQWLGALVLCFAVFRGQGLNRRVLREAWNAMRS